jgi:hypothetical protein
MKSALSADIGPVPKDSFSFLVSQGQESLVILGHRECKQLPDDSGLWEENLRSRLPSAITLRFERRLMLRIGEDFRHGIRHGLLVAHAQAGVDPYHAEW